MALKRREPAMLTCLTLIVTLLAALGSGVTGGVFFAFSNFVMAALHRRPPAEGMAAMQAINITVLNRWVLGVLFGTAVLCVLAILALPWQWGTLSALCTLLGAVLYLAGCIGVTMRGNVPLNNRLAPLVPTEPASADVWSAYLRDWTRWNHVRTAACLAAAALFIIAMWMQGSD
jgi:uncharacterized membrane protein